MQTLENKSMKSALNEKPGFHVWWRLLRPHTLTASFVPVFIGTVLAALEGSFYFLLFFAMLVASMLIQAATNMFNEYFDHKRGLDNENSVGIGGTIVRDGIAPKTVLTLAWSFFAASVLLGIYISMESSWWVAAVGTVSMLHGYLYTGGPYPIAYTPFGEAVSGFFMGTVIILISFFIQTKSLTGEIALITIPVAILIGLINLSNNIRDREGDQESGRRTLAILVGHDRAVMILLGGFIVSFLITVVYVGLGILPLWSLVTLFAIVKAYHAYKGFKGKTKNVEMIPAMVATAKTNTIYGLLLSISLLIQIFVDFSL